MLDATVDVSIELFGTARIACGRKHLKARLPENAAISDVAVILAQICPNLVGVALRNDLAGLLESYTLNLNATSFISDNNFTLKDGDTLLLFSSQSGG